MMIDPEELSPATQALLDAMIGSAPPVHAQAPVAPAQWVAYIMDALPAADRAALERRAAQEETSREELWEAWHWVEFYQRSPLTAIGGTPIADAYLAFLTRPIPRAAKGLADLIREGGDAARLALTTLSAALKSAASAGPGFAPVFRSGATQILLEETNQPAEATLEADSIRIDLGEPTGERLYVALELGKHRLSLGIAEAESGGYRLSVDPAVVGRHRLIARWNEWPVGSDAPLVQIEGAPGLSLSGIPEIADGILRIPIARSGMEAWSVGIFCAFAPGVWQYLGQREISPIQSEIEIEYPASGGAFPWPLRLTVQGQG